MGAISIGAAFSVSSCPTLPVRSDPVNVVARRLFEEILPIPARARRDAPPQFKLVLTLTFRPPAVSATFRHARACNAISRPVMESRTISRLAHAKLAAFAEIAARPQRSRRICRSSSTISAARRTPAASRSHSKQPPSSSARCRGAAPLPAAGTATQPAPTWREAVCSTVCASSRIRKSSGNRNPALAFHLAPPRLRPAA